MESRIGILHPGQMGASVGAAVRAGGRTACWASAERSEATRRRAEDAELVDVGTVEALCNECDVVLSVCPPDRAIEVARSVEAASYGGIFVDANAVSPTTAEAVRDVVVAGGARFIDGGIVGPPAWESGRTRLYLSGEDTSGIAALFDGSPMGVVELGNERFAASALKMAYASWTKGTSALLMAVRALAEAYGVGPALVDEWNISQEGLADRSDRVVKNNAFKAWRFAGEMGEIADTFAAADLPDGFHRAAREVYQRLASFKDADPAPTTAEVTTALLSRGA